MTTAFVYRWTNQITGKWYIGSRTKPGCHPDDGYICSSRKVKPLILESKDEWKRTILCIGEPQYILELETKLLQAYDAKHNPMSYNMHNGDGKFTTLGKEAWNKGIKRPTGKPAWNSGMKCPQISAGCMGRVPHNKGKPMSDSLKQNLSEKMTGRTSPKKGKPGPLQTAESNAKRSETLKGRKQTPEQISKKAAARRAFYQRKREAEASLLNPPA